MSEFYIGDYFKAISNKLGKTSNDEIEKNEMYLISIFDKAARSDNGTKENVLEVKNKEIFDDLVSKGLDFLSFARNNPGFDADLDYDQDNKITNSEIERIVDKSNQIK